MQFLWRESCNFKIARVKQVRFSMRFAVAISQGFRTCLKLDATSARQKLHRVAATKIACVNGPLDLSGYLAFTCISATLMNEKLLRTVESKLRITIAYLGNHKLAFQLFWFLAFLFHRYRRTSILLLLRCTELVYTIHHSHKEEHIDRVRSL